MEGTLLIKHALDRYKTSVYAEKFSLSTTVIAFSRELLKRDADRVAGSLWRKSKSCAPAL